MTAPKEAVIPFTARDDMSTMSIERLIQRVTQICKENNVQHLMLIGSFATGTATPTSDIDFVVYDCPDILKLEKDLEHQTLSELATH